DRIVAEPVGGAQRDRAAAMAATGDAVAALLAELDGLAPTDLRADRRAKFMAMGERGLAG
ncbi:MAG: acetyl-CoA carboxylase carboxyl transferase subunit alpha, partial [Pseudomonadota bacterium]